MLIPEFFDCIMEGRPFDQARATRQARRLRDPFVREAMRSDLTETQETQAVSSAQPVGALAGCHAEVVAQ